MVHFDKLENVICKLCNESFPDQGLRDGHTCCEPKICPFLNSCERHEVSYKSRNYQILHVLVAHGLCLTTNCSRILGEGEYYYGHIAKKVHQNDEYEFDQKCEKCQIDGSTKLCKIIDEMKVAGEINRDYPSADIAYWHHLVAANDVALNFNGFFGMDQDEKRVEEDLADAGKNFNNIQVVQTFETTKDFLVKLAASEYDLSICCDLFHITLIFT